MKPLPKNTGTKDRNGESCRGYMVLVPDKPTRKPGPRKIPMSYPASGHPYLTGREAIKAMVTLKRRGFAPVAFTASNGFEEMLTLEDLREVVL